MKKFRKILSVVLTLVMVLAMAVPGFAADATYTVTIDSQNPGHEYEAYQIFTGSLYNKGDSENPDYVLSDIEWGAGVNGISLLTALKGDSEIGTYFTSCDTAADVADAMAKITSKSDDANKMAEIVGKYLTSTATSFTENKTAEEPITTANYTAELAAGYYLIKDSDDSLSGETSEAYTQYIAQVVGPVTVSPKSGVPEAGKYVKDANDSLDDSNTENIWKESADYDIGDYVPFRLTATIGSEYSQYDKYKLVFHDNLDGLAYDTADENCTLVVKVGETVVENGYTVKTSGLEAECDLEIVIADLNALTNEDGEKINVSTNSVISVEYFAKLTESAEIGATGNSNTMYLEYSNNPNGENTSTGNTPEKEVKVYTYQAVVNKVQENPAFDESQPESEINKEYISLEGADFKLEKNVGTNEGEIVWQQITHTETVDDSTSSAVFTFKGLDDGIYRLSEIKTPNGYNSISDIYFKVEATHGADGLTSVTATEVKDGKGTALGAGEGVGALFTNNMLNDVLAGIQTDILNKAGATLPSTGGIGTTIFYAAGIVLMAGAVFFVVRRKRA